ncbi:MAG: hypothetical protein IJQ12_11255 [Lachnospiraceae bacterium]|nr:hypothetical protein [Lachnospiraceae bacterium]
MNLWDILILFMVGGALVRAVRVLRRKAVRGTGGCFCGAGCTGACSVR